MLFTRHKRRPRRRLTIRETFSSLGIWSSQGARRFMRHSFETVLVALAATGTLWAQTPGETAPGPQLPAKYVGSRACQSCHADIYARWQKTPMANVVRDPREHPEAILPDPATNTVSKFTRDDVALVYGSIWKQRY